MLRKIFLGAMLAAAAALSFAQEAGYQAPELTVEKNWDVSAPVYRITIHGSSDAAALAKRAFSTHGSFKVVQADGQYAFDFVKAGENAVAVTITGARPFTQTVQGRSLADAVARACDLVVAKVLGQPGYFAGKLAFVSDRTGKTEIYTSDMLFQNIRALTADKSDSMLPHWSPDGGRILYTGYYRTRLMDLYEINLAENSRRTFASYKGTNTGGEYSPDGGRVAMILTSSGNAEIWVSDSKGSNVRRVTKTPSVEASASWSPDGRELVFSSDAMGGPQLYRMPAAGGAMKRIRTNISKYCTEPDWNPRFPDLIAFTTASGRGFQVAVHDMKTGKTEIVTSGGSSTLPKWTNDGRHIVFTRSNGKSRALYLVDSITKKQTPLHTPSLGNCGEADYIYNN